MKLFSRISLTAAALAAFALGGCGKDEDPAEYAKEMAKAQRKPRSESKITKIQTPVPPGKKVACDSWVDPALFSAALAEAEAAQMAEGELLELEDKSSSEVDPTSICAFRRPGAPPDEKAQEKAFNKNNMKLGVVPGDEVCLVHLYCAFVNTPEDLETKCGKDPMQNMSEAIPGRPACVRRTQRAAKWAYKYSVIDTDTECTLEVQGGPSVTDEDLVQRCTMAALESLAKEGIASWK